MIAIQWVVSLLDKTICAIIVSGTRGNSPPCIELPQIRYPSLCQGAVYFRRFVLVAVYFWHRSASQMRFS